MATIDVREADAGPALDAACAEAMGWERRTLNGRPGAWWQTGGGAVTKTVLEWKPSTNIGAAWELVVWSHEIALDFELEWMGIGTGKRSWSCYMGNGYGLIYARTAPLAICRAFLLAHGVTEIEVSDD